MKPFYASKFKRHSLLFLSLLFFLNSGFSTGTPFSLLKSFSGKYGYTVIGKTESSSELCPQEYGAQTKYLSLPAGTSVEKAYLYWSGSGAQDTYVTFNGQGVNAQKTFNIPLVDNYYNLNFYGGYADVTNHVNGSGNYTVGSIRWEEGGQYCEGYAAYGGWSLVVVYNTSGNEECQINVYDGFTGYWPAGTVTNNFGGINFPSQCSIDAELTHVTWEGDSYKGEYLYINDNYIGNNTLNGSTSPNLDIDSYNISNYVSGGSSSVSMKTTSFLTSTPYGNGIEWSINNVAIVKTNICNPCANQGGDSDGDGICDNQDNCDFNANPNQADSDGDGIGDACDNDPCNTQGGDSDGDGVCDNQDNCDNTFNPDQADNDGDGIGNVCDDTPNGDPCANQGGDSDGDGVCDNQDNCDFNANPNQADSDGDGIGDACDNDPCNTQGGDSDGDGVCNNQDNCDNTFNPDQADNDGDGIGNVCDDTPNGDPCANQGGDSDGDGVCDNQDNCDFTANPNQADSDGDGIGDACDNDACNTQGGDSDGDGVCDNQDNCDFTFNPDQADNDGDGIGNVCDDTPNGDPCANNGGDSDGDGVCDNQDNCDFTPNPDQADNDGDGIGNVCDDTPNGGGNDKDCNDVAVTGEDGKITITDIPSDAKVEISGPSTSWAQQVVCEGNCNDMEMVSSLAAGNYTVTIQTFNPYCYNQIAVTVTGGGNGNPCDGQGGDSDGDGICDDQDNCDFTANPDQADNDGDGIGNACDDTPNGGGNGSGDCNDVNATGSDGKVTINNIPAGAKIEISGPSTSWAQQLVCNGGCSAMEMVSNLTAGDYTITAQTFNPYCYNRITVTVTGGGTGNPCDGQGGDSDGDGICDNQDNCDFTSNPDQADNDGDGIGNVCDDTPNGGGNGGADCNDVTASGSDGKVTINNIPSDAKVEISGPSTSWSQQVVCEGNCSTMEMVSSLAAGNYTVTIQTFNPYCYNQIAVNVTGGGTGNPCDGQGGDSDGDGICDNQDNCDFTSNPDQADNDGDGIGNVCDDTPNGGGNGADCNDVTASGSDGKVTINNIPSGAKIEISGPSTSWAQQVVCEGGSCSTMEMVSGLAAGNYTITAQTFSPYCYKQIAVSVTGGGNGNPCDGQGGDSDGDGICDNQDNCDFTANPDQADNDGDGIGNVCDDTPNGGGNGADCNDVTASGSDGKVTINNIPSGAKIEISGPSTSWAQQVVCEGGSCSTMEMVSGLVAGNYTITAQTFSPYCYKQIAVSVTGGGNGNPCDGQGGDSDGDGICDNQDNCDFTANPDQADNDGDGIGNVCDDTPNGGGNGADCNDVTASGSDGKVTINNIPADAKIEISGPSTSWAQQLVCEGDCSSMEMVSNLAAGNYTVTVQTFNPYCYTSVSVTVTGDSGNPCDNEGGDSDGDGVCDNLDNCDFTFNPDQADNDEDGIGNVCDDTPNGDPCGLLGGDSDGDGICDFQDNCDFTANPNQADSDGDGIGDACDNDPCNTEGGDSDGDGVCDNLDNCDFTFNPDQADNDEDGIGNVCDDTPNGDPCGLLGGDADGDGVCAMNDCDDNNPNIPNNLPCDDGCNQNGCTEYRGNVDFKAIGNSMNYAEDRSNCNKRSSSSANLSIPNGTAVKSATLYWSGSGSLDRYVKLNGANVTASQTWTDWESSWNIHFFAASADVTNLVNGSGNYSVSSLAWDNTGNYCQSNAAYGAWSLVVIYEGGSTPLNTIQVCADDFRFTFPGGNYSNEIRCINPPQGCNPTGELTIIAFEGDNYKGENFYIEGQQQSGSNNFRGQTAPNLDIVTFNIDNYLSSNTSKIGYTIQSYEQSTIWGQAIEGLFDLVRIVKYGCGNASSSRSAPMLDFAAYSAQREVELQWVTNTGYMNDYYVIEKSTDGSSFEALQRVDNLDFSDDMEAYNGIDPTPALGDNYYRIKQVYNDGTFDYTDVQNIHFNIDLESLSMYPNPAQNELNFNLKAVVGKATTIQIINNFGQVVQSTDLGKVESSNVHLSLDNMTNGFYQVLIQVEGQKPITKKLIVEKMY